jgi:hypothetical protein
MTQNAALQDWVGDVALLAGVRKECGHILDEAKASE